MKTAAFYIMTTQILMPLYLVLWVLTSCI